jgi:hypothetical protein
LSLTATLWSIGPSVSGPVDAQIGTDATDPAGSDGRPTMDELAATAELAAAATSVAVAATTAGTAATALAGITGVEASEVHSSMTQIGPREER